jgi:prepilin-type N-terminal cleavage/methylation domain-containing protein
MKRKTGLTLVEVLVALAVLGVVITVLSASMVTSMQQNLVAGGRTQAVQILNHLGRLASGGDARVITETQVIWDYGQLPTVFTEMATGRGLKGPERFRAEITRVGALSIGAASMEHYRVQVCWQAADGELCVSGDTAGPAAVPPGGHAPPLPFVN